MKGVFGKPYICLDPYIDITGLKNIVEEINYGIAKSHAYIKPNFAATYQIAETNKDKSKDFGSAYRCWLSDTDSIRKQRGQDLLTTDPIAFEYWLEYEYNVMEVMSYLVLRDYDKLFADTYVPCDALKENNFKFKWQEFSNNFPEFKEWCEKLPFKQLGPVVLLLKTAGSGFPLHTDVFYADDNYEHQEHFIWLDPRGDRTLCIHDKETNTTYNMDTGVAYYWNNHDWHGGLNKIDRVSWAIRIEGIFNDDLVTKLRS
jgi:hypothetical protein